MLLRWLGGVSFDADLRRLGAERRLFGAKGRRFGADGRTQTRRGWSELRQLLRIDIKLTRLRERCRIVLRERPGWGDGKSNAHGQQRAQPPSRSTVRSHSCSPPPWQAWRECLSRLPLPPSS